MDQGPVLCTEVKNKGFQEHHTTSVLLRRNVHGWDSSSKHLAKGMRTARGIFLVSPAARWRNPTTMCNLVWMMPNGRLAPLIPSQILNHFHQFEGWKWSMSLPSPLCWPLYFQDKRLEATKQHNGWCHRPPGFSWACSWASLTAHGLLRRLRCCSKMLDLMEIISYWSDINGSPVGF